MFKSIRFPAVTILMVFFMIGVLSACSANQAASPAVAQATPTTARPAATPTTVEATATAVAAKPTATQAPTTALTATTEANPTAAAPKATPAALKPAATPAAMAEEFVARMTKDKTLGDILTDDKGMTLYTFKNDKPNESTCDAACAKTWPPVVVKDEQAKFAPATGITGKFGVIERQDGAYQVTYNEMPLYRYAQDTKPGDTTGENVKEIWHVATVGETGMSESTAGNTEAMNAGGKVNGVYAANDGAASGAIAAMKAAGLKTIPPVTGQDAELAAVQRILEGEQFMTVYKAIRPEAEQAAQLAYDLLTKADIPTTMTEGKTVNNGKMDVPSVLLVPVAATKSNINDTIVKDNFWSMSQICTSEYAKVCTEAGLK